MLIFNIKNRIEKCHEILFLEIAENPSVLTCKFARYRATPKPGTERWVHRDCTAGLGYPHSVHIPNGSVQTALIRSGDGLKVALGSCLESIFRYSPANSQRHFEAISLKEKTNSSEPHTAVDRMGQGSLENAVRCSVS